MAAARSGQEGWELAAVPTCWDAFGTGQGTALPWRSNGWLGQPGKPEAGHGQCWSPADGVTGSRGRFADNETPASASRGTARGVPVAGLYSA